MKTISHIQMQNIVDLYSTLLRMSIFVSTFVTNTTILLTYMSIFPTHIVFKS